MTAVFWTIAAALIAAALSLLLWPLLRRRGSALTHSRRALNTAVYRDQLAELEKDRAAGSLSEADYNQAREELQRRLLEDAALPEDLPNAGVPKAHKTAIALLVAVPLAATMLYGKLGTPAALAPEFQSQAAAGGANPHAAGPMAGGGGDQQGGGNQGGNAGQLDQLVVGLAAKLEKKPDPQGYAMLGRAYKALGRYDDAEQAFAKAGSIMDSDPILLLEQAEIAAVRNGGNLEGKPRTLIEKALKLNPDHPQALLLAGSAAYFRKDFGTAVGYWERMLKQLPPGSEDAQALTKSIAKARSQMAGGGSGGTVAAALAPVLAEAGPAKAAPAAPMAQAAPAAAGGGSISGRVELAAALKAKAAAGDALFIFARAVQGPRMPLAVLRGKVSDLPMDFKLDDSMAMAPGMNLSSFPEVRIEAKISKTGDAMAKSGDLTGSMGPVKVGAKGVKVTIDQVAP